MTRYEKGFLTKCAEYGINGSYILARKANAGAPTGATVGTNDYLSSIIGGSVLGGLAGGLFSKEDRLKNAILGALLGGAAGGGIHYGVENLWNNRANQIRSEVDEWRNSCYDALRNKYKNYEEGYTPYYEGRLKESRESKLATLNSENSNIQEKVKNFNINTFDLNHQVSILQKKDGVSNKERAEAFRKIQSLLGEESSAPVLRDIQNRLRQQQQINDRNVARKSPAFRKFYVDRNVASAQSKADSFARSAREQLDTRRAEEARLKLEETRRLRSKQEAIRKQESARLKREIEDKRAIARAEEERIRQEKIRAESDRKAISSLFNDVMTSQF